MSNKGTVLVIEDKTPQYRLVSEDLKAGGWLVRRGTDEASAWRELDLSAGGPELEAVVIDLGLPPGVEDPHQTGAPLAEAIRHRYPHLPILAYTGISPTDEKAQYDVLLSRFLPLGISFVYYRALPDEVPLCRLLEQVRLGFFVLGPGPADYLSRAVATLPDPLGKKRWDTLSALSQGLTDEQIAEMLQDISESGSRYRITKIREVLLAAGFFRDVPQIERRELIRWYKEHRVRYRRP